MYIYDTCKSYHPCSSPSFSPPAPPRRVGLPELKRLRRQFVKQAGEWNAAAWKERRGQSREVAVADAFLDYVGTQID